MFKDDPGARGAAREMFDAVKEERLAGIYIENQLVPAKRARQLGTWWWQLIPKGEDAALVLDAADPLAGAPLIAFRNGVRPMPALLDAALRKAFASFRRLEAGELTQCPATPLDVVVAEVSSGSMLSGLIVSNIVPTLCMQAARLRRLRLSVWADPQFVKEGNIKDAQGSLDDVTLLRTLSNDATAVGKPLAPLQLTFDKMFLQGSGDAKRNEAYRQMVAMCHSHGIQILAGYGIVIEKRIGARFNAWLRDPKRSPTIEEYTRQIVRFLLTLSLDSKAPAVDPRERFDGLGLDIETLNGDLGNQFTEFCQVLARRLAAESMILAVAAGGMISEEHAFQGPPDRKTSKRPKPLPALPSARATQYKMGIGCPNLLIRPMAYDIDLSGRQLAQWHKEIIAFATDKVGLPEQPVPTRRQDASRRTRHWHYGGARRGHRSRRNSAAAEQRGRDHLCTGPK